MDTADVVFAVFGGCALLAAVLPPLLRRRPLSLPIAFLALGAVVFALPLGLPDPDPLAQPELTLHLTEIAVLVALMGAGLRLDRRLGWRAWNSTWRLLAVAMPVTIALTAWVGWWWAGLAPATAVLVGAAIAPTDPVLASDVQVGDPGEDAAGEDEVRFALTSEAGLNDALAFPFVYAAIAMATVGTNPVGWAGQWLAVDVVYRLAIGLVVGIAAGKLLGRLFFRAGDAVRVARHGDGFAALAATFLSYGVAELLAGYGFLAVFVCALTVRDAERSSDFHQVLHEFIEQIERLLVVLLLLLLGGAMVRGLLEPLTSADVVVAIVVLLVVRPLAAGISLVNAPGTGTQRAAIAAFGIRGIGSLFYIAYGLASAPFPQADRAWALVGLVVLLSVVLHGVLASPVMARIDARHPRPGGPQPQPAREAPSGTATGTDAGTAGRGVER